MSIWDAVENIARKRGKKHAIGEVCDGETVFWSYEKLMLDAHAASVFLNERSHETDTVTISGLGAYGTAVFMIAASRLGYSVSVADKDKEGIFIESTSSCQASFVSKDELQPILAGILSLFSLPDLPPKSGESYITFLSDVGDAVTYSESAAMLSAEAFAEGCALSGADRLLNLISENTPEGLFCGILSPIVKGASSVKCDDPRDLLRRMKLVSPTKLFCPPKIAGALLLKLLRIKRLPRRALDPPQGNDTLKKLSDPTLMLCRRLMQPRITYALGGHLRSVITPPPLSPRRSRAFLSFGIFAVGVYSEKGLVSSMFHYGGDRAEVWRLPSGSRADVCRVQRNGVGQILLFSPAIREGDHTDSTYVPLEKHFDSVETALVSRMSGFILRDGSVFEVR
jgi:hypothetical protein